MYELPYKHVTYSSFAFIIVKKSLTFKIQGLYLKHVIFIVLLYNLYFILPNAVDSE